MIYSEPSESWTINATHSDFYYDPDQDPEEKRAVRKNYRSLARTVEGDMDPATFPRTCLPVSVEKQANPNDYTAEELTEQVHQADTLFDKGSASPHIYARV